MNGTTMKIRF